MWCAKNTRRTRSLAENQAVVGERPRDWNAGTSGSPCEQRGLQVAFPACDEFGEDLVERQ